MAMATMSRVVCKRGSSAAGRNSTPSPLGRRLRSAVEGGGWRWREISAWEKRTLLQRFVGDSADAWWVATVSCVESRSGAEPYGPVLTAIDRLAARRPDIVVEVLRRCAPTWLAQLPWLTDRVDPVILREVTLQSSRRRLLRELVRLLDELSTVAPLMLVFDDVHWSDPATVDAIDTIATISEPARLLVVTGHRPADALATDHPITAVIARHDTGRRACRLRLDPFPGHDVTVLVRDGLDAAALRGDGATAVDRVGAVDERVIMVIADQIAEWTGGNALFAVTAVDHVRRQMVAGGGVEEFDGATVLDQLPPSLRDLLSEQLARLDPDDLAVLEAAALIGSEVLPDVVAEVLELDGVDVERSVARLARTTAVLSESSVGGEHSDRHPVVEFAARRVPSDGARPGRQDQGRAAAPSHRRDARAPRAGRNGLGA